jgi:acyl-homoserine-lactone acylase
MSRRALIPALLLLVPVAIACRSDPSSEVVIYRDTWGVAHIYANTIEAAAYAHGYVQAEDRLDDLLTAYLMAVGRAASVLGEDAIEADYLARVAAHESAARTGYERLGADTRGLIEAYIAGVRSFMQEHPSAVPDWAEAPEPIHVVALFRAFLWNWPWGQARGDLRRAGSHVSDGRGSNQWVVGPGRSAVGAPIALIDPHLSWDPQNRFYEAHVHGGDLNFYGFSIVGTPVMALGHTDVLSFAPTTGGPDCADVYEERLHPEDPMRYELDGEWLPIEFEDVQIDVRTSDGTRVETRRIERTRHGPIVRREGDRAYAVRTAYDEQIGLVEQWLQMILSRDLSEFTEAMAMNQSLPQNIMYADVHGETYYVRAGRVPVRPDGFRWDRPVPGWTTETDWQGVHPLSDLVQVRNPAAGLMQNCNGAPDTMMPDSPLTAERYLDYIYNIRPGRVNGRGRRALALLEAQDKLTVEQAIAIALDTYVEGHDRWQAALDEAIAAQGRDHAELDPAVALIEGWDGRTDADSTAATLYRFWMRATREEGSDVARGKVVSRASLDDDEQRALLDSLLVAARQVTERYGRIDPAWGEIHRLTRGDGSWPVGGCSTDGLGTLRAVRYAADGEDGGFRAVGGQFSTMVVVLEADAVESYSASPFGVSEHPDSPHFADQGEHFFSPGRLKPTWYQLEDLLQHVESERTLTVPSVLPIANAG